MKTTKKEYINRYGRKVIQETSYNSDGVTIWYITESDPETGNKINRIEFRCDGVTIWYIEEYNPQTGKLIKETTYIPDGKTVWCIDEYDPKTSVKTKTTFYNADGTINSTSKPAFVTTIAGMLVITILVTTTILILASVF